MVASVLAVAFGAAAGALLRWRMAVWLNVSFPALPPGTLMANLLGAYLIGIAMAVFLRHPVLSPELRLLIVTGFLGGLTTFSSYSMEMVANIMEGRYGLALAGTAAHVVGSLVCTGLGIATVAWIARA